MPSIHLESLTPFGRLALKLDTDFSELARISGQLQRLDIDSDSGFDRAVKLLDQFGRHGQSIAEGIQNFSQVLQEARDRSEAAVNQVAERAQKIRQRKQQQDQIQERLGQIEASLKAVNAGLSGFRKEGRTSYTDDEKRQIRIELERVNVDLKRFFADAQAIKEEARQSKFKMIEGNAQALLDVLRSSRRKVEKVLTGEQA